MIEVINKKDNHLVDADYIGRGSILGNRYATKQSKFKDVIYVESTEEALILYEEELQQKLLSGDTYICHEINKLIVRNLKNENIYLECFCKPDPCHGDIIKKIVEEKKYCLNWFSNMRRFDKPLIYEGISYWTVENFYQAMKTEKADLETRKKIAQLNPGKSKSEGQKIKIRSDWNDKKLGVMEIALRHKFQKGTSWKKKLDSFKEPIIEWNNWSDVFWGIDIFTGKGENHLGRLIEKMR